MKAQILCIGLILGLLGGANVARAQHVGHYPAGVEGIKGGSLPPPGLYLRDYNLFAFADRFPQGGPPEFENFVYANAPRLVYITDYKILGGNYGADILVPIYYSKVKYGPSQAVTDSTFALGDIMVEPITLSWHWKQFDLGAGYAFWAPNGDSGTPARVLSKSYWSHMLTLGGTWFVDEAKSWALSSLNRYEIHHESDDVDPATGHTFTAGHTLTMEWGLSKAITKTIDIGAVGYYVQQTTPDSGAGTSDALARVFAVGPEVSAFIPQWKLFASLRYEREFGARYVPEGNRVCLTLTKIF